MSPIRFLADTSAVVRLLRDREVRTRWASQITAGVIGINPITELELLYSARSQADREEWLELLNATFAWIAVPDRAFTRAAEIQAALTARGTHRSAGAVDLLVAATAELSSLTLVHYDNDFDEIVKVTSQPTAWVAVPGTVA